MANFGDVIKRLREERRMTQDELAVKAAVSRSLIQAVEGESKPSIRPRNYRAIASAFGLSPEALDSMWMEDMPRKGHRMLQAPGEPLQDRVDRIARAAGITPDKAREFLTRWHSEINATLRH